MYKTQTKSTPRAQISNKAAHYLYSAKVHDLESQHGDQITLRIE